MKKLVGSHVVTFVEQQRTFGDREIALSIELKIYVSEGIDDSSQGTINCEQSLKVSLLHPEFERLEIKNGLNLILSSHLCAQRHTPLQSVRVRVLQFAHP
jgi:hypothetical protein